MVVVRVPEPTLPDIRTNAASVPGRRTFIHRSAIVIFAALMLLASDAHADPILLDFEALQHEDALVIDVGSAFSDQGFLLTADQPDPGSPDVFRTLGTSHLGYSGSTALSQGVSTGLIMLSRLDGSAKCC
jgi:hypothetical protein